MAIGTPQNIYDYNSRTTPEERRAQASKAGQASAAKRKQNKLWKDSVAALMAGTLTKEDEERIVERFGLELRKDDRLTQQDQIVAAIAAKAKAGDTESAKFLRDTVGQAPAQMVKVGNLDGKPFETLDLSQLSDEELRNLAEREAEDDKE